MKSIQPRHLKPTHVSGDVQADVWYYRVNKTDEVCVDVRDPTGRLLGHVQFKIRHPRKKTGRCQGDVGP